jgi:hypothetical protein
LRRVSGFRYAGLVSFEQFKSQIRKFVAFFAIPNAPSHQPRVIWRNQSPHPEAFGGSQRDTSKRHDLAESKQFLRERFGRDRSPPKAIAVPNEAIASLGAVRRRRSRDPTSCKHDAVFR